MIFKRKKKLVLMAAVMLLSIVFIISSAQGAGQPGSDADPLVTKSYVDQQIARLTSQLGNGGTTGTVTGVDSATITKLQTDVGDLTKFIIDSLAEIEALKARVNSLENGFTVVEAKANQKILLGGGAEAILRSGTALAIKGENGNMIDVSSGKDLSNGVAIVPQHLLISSRNDGRGLLIKTNAFLIIRGGYEIK